MSILHNSAWSARVLYRKSLRLLPRRFYAEYAEQMALDFDDLLQDTAQQGSPFPVATTLVRAIGDLFLSAVRERFAMLRGESDAATITPGTRPCHTSTRAPGDPAEIGGEFAKNESRFLWDGVALRGNCVMVILAGLAAGVLGLAVGMRRGDGLLGAHFGSISFAYVVPFLLAVVGTYAIFRAAFVKSGQTQFRDRLAGQCRFLLAVIALVSAAGVFLGGIWAERQWGRFWGWDSKEIGGLSVVVCALVLLWLVSKYKPGSAHLGQASLVMSLVTFVAWCGPAVYRESVGPSGLAVLVVCLIVQLAILSLSLSLSKRNFADG